MLRAAMARPLAVTISSRRSFMLVLGVIACGPAAAPLPAESPEPAPKPGPGQPAPAASAAEPVSSEQQALRERYDSVAAQSSEHGEASYYSDALSGRSTASGEQYQPARYTAAHRKLPFGTQLRVTRKDDGRSVYVRVNDRGPFGKRSRIIDVSRSAAEALGMIREGVVQVTIEVVDRSDARAAR
jgi:rare lipoprotein A